MVRNIDDKRNKLDYTRAQNPCDNNILNLSFLERPCNGIEVGRVRNSENPRLEELSGLAVSHRYNDIFYSIEDSGNDNVVYVLNKNGTLKGIHLSLLGFSY